jgi:hypothetical protein
VTAEQIWLEDAHGQKIAWKKWGPYLSERQWGTVREDCSEDGDAWIISATIRLAAGPIAGAMTAWPAFRMTNSGSGLLLSLATVGLFIYAQMMR